MLKSWEERTSLYCAYLICVKNRQSSTVKSYVSAIKDVLSTDGYIWSDNKVLLSTITKSCKLKNDQIKIRLPIQRGLLDLILFAVRRKYENTQPYLEAMYITAYLLSYYGLMRVGEISESIHVAKATDIHESRTAKMLLIVLYSSKTHGRESLPQKIKIWGRKALEITSSKNLTTSYADTVKRVGCFCPYEWTQKFIKMRPLIRNSQTEQIFIFRDGSPLQAYHLRQLLREILDSFNLDSSLYDTHSFRIGRATDLFKSGVNVEEIKHLGRWKSNAVYKYLRS